MRIERTPAALELHFDPEPTGDRAGEHRARAAAERGGSVEVVANHPHYPDPAGGGGGGPRVAAAGYGRAPAALVGRETKGAAAAGDEHRPGLAGCKPPFGPPLLPGRTCCSSPPPPSRRCCRRSSTPACAAALVLWLHDILPDGAVATGSSTRAAVLGPRVARARRLRSRPDRGALEPFATTCSRRGSPRRRSADLRPRHAGIPATAARQRRSTGPRACSAWATSGYPGSRATGRRLRALEELAAAQSRS